MYKTLNKICFEITGKCIKYDSVRNHYQDANYIYGNSYFGILHEICHYVAADDEDKKKPNLGFLDEHNLMDIDDIPQNLLRQEAKAIYLTVMLSKTKEKENIDYVKYLTSKFIDYKKLVKNNSNLILEIVNDDLSKKLQKLIEESNFHIVNDRIDVDEDVFEKQL